MIAQKRSQDINHVLGLSLEYFSSSMHGRRPHEHQGNVGFVPRPDLRADFSG